MRRLPMAAGLLAALLLLATLLARPAPSLSQPLADVTDTVTPSPIDTPTPAATAEATSEPTATPTTAPTPTAAVLYLPLLRQRTACQPAWEHVDSPAPNEAWFNELHAGKAFGSSDVWAVGTDNDNSRGFTLHWDGVAWQQVPIPLPRGDLYDIDGVASNDLWAVGARMTDEGRQSYILHWDGLAWTIVPSPSPNYHSPLWGVAARNPTDVWAVGDGLYSWHALHWDGTLWSSVPLPSIEGERRLRSIAVVGNNEAWAVGARRSFPGWEPLILHWDGVAWQITPGPVLPPPWPNGHQLYDIAAIAPDDVWAVGYREEYQPLFAHWNGREWTTANIAPSSPLGQIQAVDVVGPSDVWAVSRSDVWHWDGAVWRQQEYLGAHDLVDVVAAAVDDVWVLGREAYAGPGGNPASRPYFQRWSTTCP